MTKLYTVTATIEYVIAVDSDQTPKQVAFDVMNDAIRDMDPYDAELVVSDTKYVPYGWDANCYPYRDDRTTPATIGELLDGQR